MGSFLCLLWQRFAAVSPAKCPAVSGSDEQDPILLEALEETLPKNEDGHDVLMARVATVPGLAQLRVAPAAHFARSFREEVSTGLRITSTKHTILQQTVLALGPALVRRFILRLRQQALDELLNEHLAVVSSLFSHFHTFVSVKN